MIVICFIPLTIALYLNQVIYKNNLQEKYLKLLLYIAVNYEYDKE